MSIILLNKLNISFLRLFHLKIKINRLLAQQKKEKWLIYEDDVSSTRWPYRTDRQNILIFLCKKIQVQLCCIKIFLWNDIGYFFKDVHCSLLQRDYLLAGVFFRPPRRAPSGQLLLWQMAVCLWGRAGLQNHTQRPLCLSLLADFHLGSTRVSCWLR